MNTIQVKDKQFAVSLPAADIQRQVARVGAEITRDYAGREPLFLAVLNGAFMFAADLMREVNLPSEIQFVKIASYEGTGSTGKVRELIGVSPELVKGRPVIIVEDIVDTGNSMAHMLKTLEAMEPESIDVCTLLFKPEKLQVPLTIRYCALEIPNDFIVGYGLDYDGYGRNTADIYTIVE